MRKLGIALIIAAVLSWITGAMGLALPLIKWFTLFDGIKWLGSFENVFGHVARAAAVLLGVVLVRRGHVQWNPLTLKKWRRFRSIRRGYVSLWILGILVFLAALDNCIVGKRALMVRYEGKWHFPFLLKNQISGKTFAMEPGEAETDYRALQERSRRENKGDWVVLPLVPYDARLDTPPVVQKLAEKDGAYYGEESGKLFTGLAFTTFADKPELHRREQRFRKGLPHGPGIGKDRAETLIERFTYEDGKLLKREQLAEADFAGLDAGEDKQFRQIMYAPTAPSWKSRHFLGTDSSGADVMAIMFGGFQMLFVAAVFYILFVYIVGFSAGCLMGYLGGWADLAGQRLLEIWSALPFLYIVILIRSQIDPNVVLVVAVLAAFSWMGLFAYMRTGAYREKARDYVAAARVMGAGPGRIIFVHILPNVLSTIVTLLPFSVNALVFSLTALDYLGFGLPPGEPSWGVMLKDGTANLHTPWILSSAFAALAATLILVTFVGEAIREAYDPRKYTYYR